MRLCFEGAAGEVTGSRSIIEYRIGQKDRRFAVDWGMFQGGRDAHQKNFEPSSEHADTLECVILTHAHIDHSGLLPRLCAQGFHGPIYCTLATLDLLKVLLADSAHIQAFERERAERRQAKNQWRGDLPQPLYSLDDVTQCLAQCRPIAYHQRTPILEGVSLEFVDAGHILGSATAVIDVVHDGRSAHQPTKRIVFSGDLGTRNRPLMNDPDRVHQADVLVLESTYGNRLHRSLQSTEDELVEIVSRTLKQGGNVIMPAFAVGRTQEIIAILLNLVRQKRLPFLSIFVDSPMATAASEVTDRHLSLLDAQTQALAAWAKAHPNAARVHFTKDVNESKALNQIKGGAIILSASGIVHASNPRLSSPGFRLLEPAAACWSMVRRRSDSWGPKSP
jgi:metallo-beta-lactamase family protein